MVTPAAVGMLGPALGQLMAHRSTLSHPTALLHVNAYTISLYISYRHTAMYPLYIHH